jgi:hypothetical protein
MVRASLELDMVYGERVRAWEGGLSVLLGGDEKQTHTDGEQTTKKWETDEHARR